MRRYANNIITVQNGEGIILQKPRSLYEHGKSDSLLKLKVTNFAKIRYSLQFSH